MAALSVRSSSSLFAADAKPTFDVSYVKPGDGAQTVLSEGDAPKEESIRDYERIRLGDQHFLCSIPQPIPHNETSDTASQEEEQEEFARATDHGSELLRGMEGTCIFYNTGWWTYSFCYNQSVQSVKQFHSLPPSRQVPIYPPMEDTSVESYILGKFGGVSGAESARKDKEKGVRKTIDGDAAARTSDSPEGEASRNSTETGLARLEQKGELKYMVHELVGGTTCDLTGKARRIEIQVWRHL